ncbi:InlB B-repeat-containing protein [Qiania dongpingensis]|uniref:InlB B-repeat-containing protein n=1 Tax=Qiania dongpingensis TaxID=2763669 RepID=A0A7G9G4Q2_9FIRM|nr:InlB B-repeat-containing protein [Qiania dongpingensis]QNM05784.1 InlB B-repeat-containing protein [Qiania dongpingensis]
MKRKTFYKAIISAGVFLLFCTFPGADAKAGDTADNTGYAIIYEYLLKPADKDKTSALAAGDEKTELDSWNSRSNTASYDPDNGTATELREFEAEGNENFPDNPYVYAALTREAILAWDVPGSNESGSYSYTLCQKQGDGSYVPVKNGTGIDPSKGYFTLHKLKPDTPYTFAFQGQSPEGGSVMGADIHLTTREENSIIISRQPKSLMAQAGKGVIFEATVEGEQGNRIEKTIFQWQKLDRDGNWVDIDGACATETTSDSITTQYATGPVSLEDAGSRYRIRVTRYYRTSSQPSVSDSKSAELYVGEGPYDMNLQIVDGTENEIFTYSYLDGDTGSLHNRTAVLFDPGSGDDLSIPITAEIQDNQDKADQWRVTMLYGNAPMQQTTYDLSDTSNVIFSTDQQPSSEFMLKGELLDENGNILASSDQKPVSILTPGADRYALLYDVNGGNNAPENLSYIGAEAVGITLYAPAKQDSEFQGWRFEGSQNPLPMDADSLQTYLTVEEIKGADTKGNKSITLEAVWADKEHAITYEGADGIDNPNPAVYTSYSNVDLADIRKEGYEFTGWYEDAALTKQIRTIPGDLSPEKKGQDITLYAGFSPLKEETGPGGNTDPDRKPTPAQNGNQDNGVKETSVSTGDNSSQGNGAKKTSVSTGDNSNVWTLLAVMSAALAAGISAAVPKDRRRKQR